MDAGIELKAVTKLYRPRGGAPVRAVDRVSLAVPPGQVLGVLGPPGAGKTTLLDLAAGRTRPTYGEVVRGEAGVLTLEEPGRRADLRAPGGRPVLVTTRDLTVAAARCDRVVLMDRGRLVADVSAARLAPLALQEWYELRLDGQLDGRAALWFDGFAVTATGDGETVLTGALPDQAALHGVLKRVRDLGLPLIAARRTDPDWGALFLALR